MKTVCQLFLPVLFLFTLTVGPASAGATLDLQDKVALQAAMQKHIDRSLVEGVYLHLDLATGQVHRLHPGAAHPMIFRMGEYYVLCADFRDADGRRFDVDFYLAARGRSYSVFHTAVDGREPLKRLIQAGKVEKTD